MNLPYYNDFTASLKKVVERAKEETSKEGISSTVNLEHLILGILSIQDGSAYAFLEEEGVSYERFKRALDRLRPQRLFLEHPISAKEIKFSAKCIKAFELAKDEALKLHKQYIGTEHLLLGILRIEEDVTYRILVIDFNITYEVILDKILRGSREGERTGLKSGKLKNLETFSTDLTKLAKEGKLDPVIGREKEIERVVQILSRRTKNNPCLIGEPGVGKTAIAEGLAQRIVEGNIPEILKDKRVVTLDLSSMVAGAKYRGEFEERLKKALDEIRKSGNIILFIDEMHTIIGAGAAEGAIDASNILKPSLARGEIQVIGATTLDEYRKHVEKDAALERRFQPVTIGEPSEEEAIRILKGLRDKYEAHHRVKITDEALEAAVKLSARYITDRFLPDKAIDLVDEAASRVRLKTFTAPPDLKSLEEKLQKLSQEKEAAIASQEFEKAAAIRDEENKIKKELQALKDSWYQKNQTKTDTVTEEDIAEIVSSWTGIPVKKLAEEETERLMKLEEVLHNRVIGQDEAVKAVAKAIRRGRVGLKDPKRPIGSFIFLGPTGVGKTELTKALAEAMFGDENAMVRIDMSEYMEKFSISRLIGSPPGYVGYEEGGQLTEKVRRKPYSVVLFDEIEKAHPDVFNLLLQILEDGRLTDSQGRVVNFKNTIIIMTSNVGARLITEPKKVGFAASAEDKAKSYEDMKNNVMSELKKTFRPEFLNRVDEIIVFHPLDEVHIKQIVQLMVRTLANRLKQNNIYLEATDDAISFLAKKGFDPVYGARPLRRAIQSMIEDKLAEEMLEGRVKPGDRVVVDAKDEEIKISLG